MITDTLEAPSTATAHAVDLGEVAVILPARNEEQGLARVLPPLFAMGVGQVIVADNGSTDRTGEVARELGATVVREDRLGYGAACFAGMQALASHVRAVAFLDADGADDPELLPAIAGPVLAGEADLVIGARVPETRERGAMTLPQVFGNWLATTLIRLRWRHRYTDLGPFRAIDRAALAAMSMRDRRFGWTVEMQVRALQLGHRVREVPVPYRPRVGKSKISGTIRGTVLAGYWILRTIAALWWCGPHRPRQRQVEQA